MASKKQILQREIYKKGIEIAKKKYAKYPENKKSRKAWNKCLSESIKQAKTNKILDKAIKEQNKPKNTGKHWLEWEWSD